MLRKDLLPGDVFNYSPSPLSTQDLLFYVTPKSEVQPSQYYRAQYSSDDSCMPNKEVVLLWRDPARGGLGGPKIAPIAKSKADGPTHYTAQTPEPIDAIEGWNLGPRLANVVKYVARAGKKDGTPAVKDLQKAIRYLAREINALEGRKSWEYAVK